MFNNNNGYSLADIAAATGNGNNGGFGGFGGDGAWVLLLFIIILMGGWNNNGGWGNGGNGGGGFAPYVFNTTSEVQHGFDQQAIMSDLGAITGAVTNGFAQAEIAENGRQFANMNQLFGLQTGLSNQLNNIAMNQQNCCCENRAAVADLKYTVANEACADRAAVEGALRDVTAQGVANTQALLNTINGGIQSLKDQLCQDKIDAKNELIANLRQEIAMKDLAASQVAQNAFIQQGFANEVDQLYNRLNSCPVPTTPVYGRTPIFTCNNGGCGCGNNAFYN